ncbi:hypothetical protein [Salegentibacter maritimus]|uniref:hypothetical protein n=1 Tax=Salegentibacter maritimus TaxID=2794347 RepID=UPI0018E44D83|nr:hypothetical protein [Salegentibacter maritimus]MBI6116408.1 hypothetical protein [Salegentibacter maritimus]
MPSHIFGLSIKVRSLSIILIKLLTLNFKSTKKLVLPLAMAFMMSPMLNASVAVDRICHEMAKVLAEDSGAQGDDYAREYMEHYEYCEENMN